MTKQEQAIELLKAGNHTAKEIAALLSMSLATLYKIKRDEGTVDVRQQASIDLMKEVAEFYQTHTLKQTTTVFKLSAPTVLRYAKKYGSTRGGDKIAKQGFFFGQADRETLGITEEQAQDRNRLLGSLSIDLQVSALESRMFLSREGVRIYLTVEEGIELTKDCRSWLKANAQKIKEAFGKK